MPHTALIRCEWGVAACKTPLGRLDGGLGPGEIPRCGHGTGGRCAWEPRAPIVDRSQDSHFGTGRQDGVPLTASCPVSRHENRLPALSLSPPVTQYRGMAAVDVASVKDEVPSEPVPPEFRREARFHTHVPPNPEAAGPDPAQCPCQAPIPCERLLRHPRGSRDPAPLRRSAMPPESWPACAARRGRAQRRCSPASETAYITALNSRVHRSSVHFQPGGKGEGGAPLDDGPRPHAHSPVCLGPGHPDRQGVRGSIEIVYRDPTNLTRQPFYVLANAPPAQRLLVGGCVNPTPRDPKASFQHKPPASRQGRHRLMHIML